MFKLNKRASESPAPSNSEYNDDTDRNSLPLYPNKSGFETSINSSNINKPETYISNNINLNAKQRLSKNEQVMPIDSIGGIKNSKSSPLSTLNFQVKQKPLLENRSLAMLDYDNNNENHNNNINSTTLTNKRGRSRKNGKKGDKRNINSNNKHESEVLGHTKNEYKSVITENSSLSDKINNSENSNTKYSVNDSSIHDYDINDNHKFSTLSREQNNDRLEKEKLTSVSKVKNSRNNISVKGNSKSKNSNIEINFKGKNDSKTNSSTTIKITSTQINKIKEENNNSSTRNSKRNNVNGNKNIKNGIKKSDTLKTKKETEEKKISIIIKKSLIDGISKSNNNNSININTNNSESHRKSSKDHLKSENQESKHVEKISEPLENNESLITKNIIPIKITRNIKNKLKNSDKK